MMVSALEARRAAAVLPSPPKGAECEIAANHAHYGRGWFSKAQWESGRRYFAGRSREDALEQARRFAIEWCLEAAELP